MMSLIMNMHIHSKTCIVDSNKKGFNYYAQIHPMFVNGACIQVQFCEECQRTNTRMFDKVRLERHPVKVQTPWHHIGIDLVGSLPISERNNLYILTLSDYCTKWVEAVPLESKHATGIAAALFKVTIAINFTYS